MLTTALLLVSAKPVYAQNSHKYDWDTDLDFLAKELPERHYDFFTVKSEADFLSGLEKIKADKEDKEGLTDFEIAVRVQQLIAGFGDSHTSLNLGPLVDRDMLLPVRSYWFADGLFILHTTQENSEILGHRIISVNGTPLETVADSLATLVTMDNRAMLKSYVPGLLPQVRILEVFGFAEGGEVELGLQDTDGGCKTYVIKPAAMTKNNVKSVQADSPAFCDRNKDLLFVDSYRPAEKLYYLQYNECWGRELEMQYGDKEKAGRLPSFGEFEERVLNTLKAEPVDKIVFDIRYNEGGSSPQGTRLIGKLAEHLAENPGTKVYVVLGRSTFSSAILNAMDFRRLTDAVFVGEETAGKPNHFGEVRSFPLPDSKLKVRYSTKYFRRTPVDVNTIVPDVKLESCFSDFVKGMDPVYDWILEQ